MYKELQQAQLQEPSWLTNNPVRIPSRMQGPGVASRSALTPPYASAQGYTLELIQHHKKFVPTLFQRKTSKKTIPEEFFCSHWQLRKNAKKILRKVLFPCVFHIKFFLICSTFVPSQNCHTKKLFQAWNSGCQAHGKKRNTHKLTTHNLHSYS